MEIAIVGLEKSGKTTVFNALTGQDAPVSAFAAGKAQTNMAVSVVPDDRLLRLAEIFHPKKTTPATVKYIDVAGIAPKRGEHGGGLGETQLHAISTADMLLVVVRGFEGPAGEAPDIRAEAESDLLELALTDLQKVETRLERLEKSAKKVTGEERKRQEVELEGLNKIKPLLEDGRPAREAELTEEEYKALRGFQFLTQKPMLLVVNAPEDALGGDADPAESIAGLAGRSGMAATWIAGQTEMEIGRLDAAARAEFLGDYGIEEPASAKIIRLCYDLLGYISFLTVGPDECRAWTVRGGALAPEAAGAIHSDLERGFIRAEVVRWDELLAAGSYAELKKHGKLRLEGKTYEVSDGDVINVLFSV